MENTGKVYLVGAGPGDPGLITQKGINLLKKCDAVIYDRLVSDRLLSYVKEGCEKVYVGKTVGNHAIRQEEINRIIIEKAKTAAVIVRLKGGDPFVFGRGGEEVLALQENKIPYEVIPGITSAIAAPSYAGIPITHRGSSQSFHVITGHTAEDESTLPEDLKNLAKLKGTLVILMGMGSLDKIAEELIAWGKPADTPVAIVSNGTTIWQKEVRGTLGNISDKAKEANIKAPAVIIIGNVADIDMKATIKYPLSGIRVGITGTRTITDKLTEELEELGALVAIFSSSELLEYGSNMEFENALCSLGEFHWIAFTSTNAVTIFLNKMKELRVDYRNLSHIKFAVIGSQTAQALQLQGFVEDFIPSRHTAADLATELSAVVGNDEQILIPRAEKGTEVLTQIFEENHKAFLDIKIYDIICRNEETEDLPERIDQLDYLTFASASGVQGFYQGMAADAVKLTKHTKIVCIGEATDAALKEIGIQNALIAAKASAKGLVERICEDCLEQQMER